MKQRTAGFTALLALGTFTGTVIGVGMFGLPYVAAGTGFFPFLLFLLAMAPVVAIIHLRFAKVVIGTKERERIPGYVGKYLGTGWKKVSWVISVCALTGALVAYLVVGGTFFQLLLSPLVQLDTFSAVALFFLCGSLLILFGVRSVSFVDLLLMALLGLLLVILFVAGLPHFSAVELATARWSSLPAAYGIILFSYWGLTLIPEATELVAKREAAVRGVVIIGLAISAVVYTLFTVTVLATTGALTTPDALTGFVRVVGPGIVAAAALLGFIATFTSYISLGLALRETLQLDFRLPAPASVGITIVVPFGLYLLGIQNFLEIVSVTGAVLLASEGILTLMVSEAFHRKRLSTHRLSFGTMVLLAILGIGIAVEVLLFLRDRVVFG